MNQISCKTCAFFERGEEKCSSVIYNAPHVGTEARGESLPERQRDGLVRAPYDGG
jgi:hypothetical protein